MALDPKLLEILACPKDKGPLLYFADEDALYNPRLRMRYRITDDIPVMLIDEAQVVDEAEDARLAAKAEAEGITLNWTPAEGAGSGSMSAEVSGGRLDTVGMFELTASLPEQVETAAKQARDLVGQVERGDVQNVVVIGMGGSGISGDVVTAVTEPLMPVPITVCKSYECPAFVGPESLVFAISASGNTEETVQAATDAEAAGAQLIAVTSGGQLADLASHWGAPVFPVPPDIPQPRAALGAVSIPPLVVLDHLGLYRGGSTWIASAVQQLKVRRDEIEAAGESSGPARVARRIGRTMALVHGGGAVGATAAQRWKTQINENAKAPAFWAAQPELCHNEVCGWGVNGDVTRQVITAVALRHEGEHPQVGRRFDLIGEIMREVVADVIEVQAAGDGDLAQLFDLILFGDYVSLHLAVEEGVDPGPVPILGDLKAALAGP